MNFASPQARAAFADYIPSVMFREKQAVNVMTPNRDVRHLPPSYPWAGTMVADTFYGETKRVYRPAGMTNGDGSYEDRTGDNIDHSREN